MQGNQQLKTSAGMSYMIRRQCEVEGNQLNVAILGKQVLPPCYMETLSKKKHSVGLYWFTTKLQSSREQTKLFWLRI